MKTLFSIWLDIWSEMEGLRGKMGAKTSERLVQANSFFSAKKVTSRFLGNEIIFFLYFFVFLGKFHGFGWYLGYVCITLWAQGGMGGPGGDWEPRGDPYK